MGVRRTCSVCGLSFIAARSDTKTCSPACRQWRWRQRKRDRLIAPQEEQSDALEVRRLPTLGIEPGQVEPATAPPALAQGFVSDARADVAAVNKLVAEGRLVFADGRLIDRQKPFVSISSRKRRRGGGFSDQG
jgi:hypothetical protein